MLRPTVFCVVEGQSENAVLKRLIGDHLGHAGVDIHFPIVKVGRNRGGVKFLSIDELFDQIDRFLKDRRQPKVTTFFDYYGLPTGGSKGWNFVGKTKAEVSFRGVIAVADAMEQELLRIALTRIQGRDIENRFLPYLQLHELEALFFSQPDEMSKVFGSVSLAKTFADIVTKCGGCEMINDHPETAPSKRIEAAFPSYKKGRTEFAHAPRVADRLSLERVRLRCPRFDSWLSKIEKIGTSGSLIAKV